ncbi:MAG: nucleotidyl transferase AbiEii/AbiGii toxin family protein, partial [Myxococcota bacterium]
MTDGSLETIFAALENARVRYLVVGGVAVVLHGHLRFTADLDLALALDPANVRATIAALSALGYRPRAPVRAEDLADPDQRADWIQNKGMIVFSLTSSSHPTTEVDLFVEEPFPFESAYARAAWTDLESTRVPVVSLPDLVAMKRRTGRPQDLEDVRQLEAIARELENR